MTTEDLRFPLTLWPGTVVPVPPVERRRSVLAPGSGWMCATPDAGSVASQRAELPAELFLRELLDLNLESDEDVAQFLSSFGVIGLRYGGTGLLPLEFVPRTEPPAPHFSMHVGDAALFLRTARVLTRHWLAVVEGTSIASAWDDEGLLGIASAWDDDNRWAHFVTCLNWGLKGVHCRVERRWPQPHMADYPAQGAPEIGLYSGLCLQLANHICENATVRRCANESCGRAFVRQRGGAEHGQYRTEGLRYCTPACGNAQWQREHRRRKRAERNKP